MTLSKEKKKAFHFWYENIWSWSFIWLKKGSGFKVFEDYGNGSGWWLIPLASACLIITSLYGYTNKAQWFKARKCLSAVDCYISSASLLSAILTLHLVSPTGINEKGLFTRAFSFPWWMVHSWFPLSFLQSVLPILTVMIYFMPATTCKKRIGWDMLIQINPLYKKL